MSKRHGSNKENLEETRKVFLEIAENEFCISGYADASTSRIVEKSGMARGSLYYHFGDKNGLFRAVYEQAMQKAMHDVSAVMDPIDDAWDAFIAGAHKFLDLCMDDTFRKIVLIESQGAISYVDRFEIQQKTLLSKLRVLLPEIMERGYFPGHTGQTLAIFIYGALGEIGRSFDLSQNIEEDRETHGRAFEQSMKRLKA